MESLSHPKTSNSNCFKLRVGIDIKQSLFYSVIISCCYFCGISYFTTFAIIIYYINIYRITGLATSTRSLYQSGVTFAEIKIIFLIVAGSVIFTILVPFHLLTVRPPNLRLGSPIF